MFMIISVYDPLTGYRQVTERLPTGHKLLADSQPRLWLET